MEDPDKTLVDEVSLGDIQHTVLDKLPAKAGKPRNKSLPFPRSHVAMKLEATEAAATPIPPSSCPQFSESPIGSQAVRPSSPAPKLSSTSARNSKLLAPVDLSSPAKKCATGRTLHAETSVLGPSATVESRASSRKKSLNLPPSQITSQEDIVSDVAKAKAADIISTPLVDAPHPSRRNSEASSFNQACPPLSSSPVGDLPQSSPALLPPQPTSSLPTPSQPKDTSSDSQKRRVQPEDVQKEEPPSKKRRPNTNPYLDLSLAHSSVRTPFKPPTMKKKEVPSPVAGPSKAVPRTTQKDFAVSALTSPMGPSQTPTGASPSTRKRPRLSGVAAPFKSPLIRSTNDPTTASPRASSSRHAIVALEQRLQLLKQAHKIKSEGSAEKLEQLTEKWTKVARSAAEDLWQLVRDSGSVGGTGDDARADDDWGYAGEKGKGTGASKNWGWDEVDKREDDEEQYYPADQDDAGDSVEEESSKEKQKEWTMGAMLESMGIPPETLGWNAEEGEFIDIT
ncbi:hypothetical protein FS837_000124 [Tulasnella sp. UAMH 9824]|nr:hypothetical protein FS837_000124 [Tulasnella sp. UAMH 9824]